MVILGLGETRKTDRTIGNFHPTVLSLPLSRPPSLPPLFPASLSPPSLCSLVFEIIRAAKTPSKISFLGFCQYACQLMTAAADDDDDGDVDDCDHNEW